MPFYRCSIRDEEGNPVADKAMVTLEVTEQDGASRWWGTISATHLMALAPGHNYKLTLEDGRSGAFRVRRNTFAGSTDRAVAIDGMGPLG